MHFDQNSRLFHGTIDSIPADKANKLAVVEVDCGSFGIATFRLAIKKSALGNPVLTVRTIKPKTGELKKRHLMAVPIPPKKDKDENSIHDGGKTKKKKKK